MKARKRQKLLRIVELARKHSSFAETIGINVSVRTMRKETTEHQSSLEFNNENKQRKDITMLYYLSLVTDNPNHNHEVHNETCPELPRPENREYLGSFSTCRDALHEAERAHPTWCDIDGCAICCPEIHTQ